MKNNAANDLLKRTLSSGWEVTERVENPLPHSGGFFSVCYKVKKEDEVCFLKAFDFNSFMCISQYEDPSVSVMDVLNKMSTAFIYERDLSEYCKNGHVTKVVFVRESGQEIIDGYTVNVVPYLIFDVANGDVRNILNYSSKLDYAWRFKSLHDIAVGLKQLHSINVYHQDLKPSNILVFDKASKIGDLGRSICLGMDGPYNRTIFPGDGSYAPPEIEYGYFDKDINNRILATDSYLLGSLIVFYFSGVTINALIKKYLPKIFSREKWRGEFNELLSYLKFAFSKSLLEFESNINHEEFKNELKILAEYLCNPDPVKRGHPLNIINSQNDYSLERIISKLATLKLKSEIYLKE